ncbi:hypothetical protein NMY22_g18470 [Coprinellus aureogranulatus]|nr:hypothetical protein NMY22_g18470 [Coprinellus aureogranulatus]
MLFRAQPHRMHLCEGCGCPAGREEEDHDPDVQERPRPLVAVDFGHAVWIEYEPDPPSPAPQQPSSSQSSSSSPSPSFNNSTEGDFGLGGDTELESDAKRLRFVTFPPFKDEAEFVAMEEAGTKYVPRPGDLEGKVRTLEVPEELDLGMVETINIDQSQGAVILSDREGKIWILCYE